ncbi:MAG: ATP-dependent Clp protease ATP-binding subunit [bacterium]|nr:ATP-dependent Clp protease ATP-binding subunit [bacterium]
MQDISTKFTPQLKHALTRAFCVVIDRNKNELITPIHLLYALTTQESCIAAELLKKYGVTAELIEKQNGVKTVKQPASASQIPHLSEAAKDMLEHAVEMARKYEHELIGTEHLLYGILHRASEDLMMLFSASKASIQDLHDELEAVFETTSAFSEIRQLAEQSEDLLSSIEKLQNDITETKRAPQSTTPVLDYFGEDLTEKKRADTLTPVIGRSEEIERLARILSRKQKNNPMLVGEPGVGKTAIVEGLAKNILLGKVPANLARRRIIRLDLAGLLSGTMYRGEFEQRMRALIEEVREHPDIILFIDEIHTIMGTGATSGSLDAANMLKPALARGELRVIGATTLHEYKRYIEADSAFERRFQRIIVREPSVKDTETILDGLLDHYAKHHGVTFDTGSAFHAAKLANEYLVHSQLPDKAIDIIDEAGSLIGGEYQEAKQGLQVLERQIDTLNEQKQHAIQKDDLEAALLLKKELVKKRTAFKKAEKALPHAIVTRETIETIVRDMSEHPALHTRVEIRTKLQQLETALKRELFGQTAASSAVLKALRRAFLKLDNHDKPLASLLFAGPTGVGKTYLAKLIHAHLSNDTERFLRIDMSEFREGHTISKLIGSPAGYIGYRDKARLTDHVKAHPFSIVLFDEIEKAHKDVQHLLLQILDGGNLSDATGKTISFKNTIIIMTTNAAGDLVTEHQLGFGGKKADIRQRDLETWFSKELLARIDGVAIFNSLKKNDLKRIATRHIEELQYRLKSRHNVELSVDRSAIHYLVAKASERYGARDMRRMIEEELLSRVTERVLNEEKLRGITIREANNQLQLSERKAR